jgi:hypothetical protein
VTRRVPRRGNRPAALFTFADPAAGEVVPDEVQDNPLTRPCSSCGAPIAQPCTRGSRFHGRVRISGYHDARQHPPVPAQRPEPIEPAESAGTGPYRVCTSCGTGWLDEELVEADYLLRCAAAALSDEALVAEVERRDPDRIHTCPDCTHDL